jgi:hypothetical protein
MEDNDNDNDYIATDDFDLSNTNLILKINTASNNLQQNNEDSFVNLIERNFKKSDQKFIHPREVKKNTKYLDKFSNENQHFKKIQDISDELNSNKFDQVKTIPIEDKSKTLMELINDKESGIPMTTYLKLKEEKKKKINSEKSECNMANDNSNVSSSALKSSDKLLLKIKSNRSLHEEENNKNYSKYFKPKLIWDTKTNKMIIEKPLIAEASQRMNEDIIKNNPSVYEQNGDKIKITSSSFKKTMHTNKWNDEESEFFYKVLECFKA